MARLSKEDDGIIKEEDETRTTDDKGKVVKSPEKRAAIGRRAKGLERKRRAVRVGPMSGPGSGETKSRLGQAKGKLELSPKIE